MSSQQQEEYLNKLRQQIQAQTVQEIMNKMSEKCFKVRFCYDAVVII
jgi:histone H3/H4